MILLTTLRVHSFCLQFKLNRQLWPNSVPSSSIQWLEQQAQCLCHELCSVYTGSPTCFSICSHTQDRAPLVIQLKRFTNLSTKNCRSVFASRFEAFSMAQCCLGGEKSEEQVNLAVIENEKGPTVTAAAVKPKTSVPSEGDGNPVKPNATAVHGDDLKLSVNSEAAAPKSAVIVVNSKLEQPNAALKKEPKEHEFFHKMERGPKVKIVVDENRILKYIKEKQSIKEEVAMIGRGKSAQFKSSINSVPPSSAKSKCPTPVPACFLTNQAQQINRH